MSGRQQRTSQYGVRSRFIHVVSHRRLHPLPYAEAGTRHIRIISNARELGPGGHINGSCLRHEIARHRPQISPVWGPLGGRWVKQASIMTLDRIAALQSLHAFHALEMASSQYQSRLKFVRFGSAPRNQLTPQPLHFQVQ
ncbi:hypothetical protein M419DRAFT_9477 [Trichoderma reesei RUT C-30]|uniref:Uncharacterized protein n=1 Tax=Hypocrea jecorina (strain ATCC 56765 / BCRC 32924 / NRRL 11460 / Rut C-30) TaxID=1344414 RepID=A0A024S8J3_HYPJR|nr:hypothetical protein M419DRAFT_9477 [Trichoderma reesei RUT C-30]